jgi:hypothetical protein
MRGPKAHAWPLAHGSRFARRGKWARHRRRTSREEPNRTAHLLMRIPLRTGRSAVQLSCSHRGSRRRGRIAGRAGDSASRSAPAGFAAAGFGWTPFRESLPSGFKTALERRPARGCAGMCDKYSTGGQEDGNVKPKRTLTYRTSLQAKRKRPMLKFWSAQTVLRARGRASRRLKPFDHRKRNIELVEVWRPGSKLQWPATKLARFRL